MSIESRQQRSWGFALTILISSFLIFQVQPLISKYILPWFGGTPAVWTTCMLFFQVVLFAGYAYAHLSVRYLSPRGQSLVHLGLLAAAILLLPIVPDATWKPLGAEEPMWRILGLLTASVGLPYFLLSSTGPLVQGWFSRASSGASPYRLYALSNIGSVAGLVTYPFVVEPSLSAEVQAAVWSWSFGVFAIFCGGCAVYTWRRGAGAKRSGEPETITTGTSGLSGFVTQSPSAGTRWLWFGLAACASVMLLATTNQVCLDVAVIPFLWVLPLTLYLVSFILCFDHDRWYPRRTYAISLGLSMVCLCFLLYEGENAPILTQIVIHFAALFFCCMVCHGELVRLKPAPQYLTSFYLASSAGGAAGGILVGLVAPLVFHRYVELHFGMIACCTITLIVFFRDKNWCLYHGRPRWVWAGLVLAFVGLARALRAHAGEVLENELAVSRNFYGVLRVAVGDAGSAAKESNLMVHGRILHGRQFLAADKRRIPTAYYGEQSGVGLALAQLARPEGRRVGMVGLGVGTLAAYGKPGDYFRYYEINPDVIRLAREHFTYLSDSAATVDVILGDARLSLEREEPQQFDLLVLDAFSSDAIPAHLLTSEAFAIYQRHLRSDGVIAIHISNRHFDLRPVVSGAAEHTGLHAARVFSAANDDRGQSKADWMLLARDPKFLEIPALREAIDNSDQSTNAPRLWTDSYSNVVQILK